MNRDGGLESDLDLIRELLRKYGWPQFENMVQIAGRSIYEPSISSSRGSIISSAPTTASRTTSSSLSFYTDTASLRSHPGALSPWPQHIPTVPVRSSDTSRTSTPSGSFTPDLQLPSSGTGTTTLSDAQQLNVLDPDGTADPSRTKLQCPFCIEYGIGQWIGRKPDLKRHFNKIHASNAQWTCKLGGGCNLTFDFHSAYDAHVKKEHGGVKDPDAKINLCQQVVFACGFERCREVFEAKTDDHGPAVLNQYFEHVLSHVVSSACGRWSYSRRMRNLLHQETVQQAWKECDKGIHDELSWLPQSSSVLRKLLECRHIGDPMLLCKYAVLLGSGHPPPTVPPLQFSMPTLNTCKIVSPGHDPRHDPRFSKGGFLGFRTHRNPSTPRPPRPSGRITGSQPKRLPPRSAPSLTGIPPTPATHTFVKIPPHTEVLKIPAHTDILSPYPKTSHSTQSDILSPYSKSSHSNSDTLSPYPKTSHSQQSDILSPYPKPSHSQPDIMPSYTSHSEFVMEQPNETTLSLNFQDQSTLPILEYHPLELYSGYQSLGEPPSLHQFLGSAAGKPDHDHDHSPESIHHHNQNHQPLKVVTQGVKNEHARPRRASSPTGSDCHMGGDSPVVGMADFAAFRQQQQQQQQHHHHHQQQVANGCADPGRRRSSSAMDFVLFSQDGG